MLESLQMIGPVLAVAVTALVVLAVDMVVDREDPRVPAALALVGLGIAAVLAFLRWSVVADGGAVSLFERAIRLPGGAEGTAAFLTIDAFGIYLQMALLAFAALVALSAVDYLRQRRLPDGELYALLLFATAAMMLLAVAADLLMIFLAIETFSILLYALCGFGRAGGPRGLEAGLKYFTLGAFSAGFLLYGVALSYAAFGTTSLAHIGAALGGDLLREPLVLAALAMLLVGLGFKVAVVPFHQWTPDVYEGAPLPVTAFMSAGTKAAVFAVLIRVLWTAFPALYEVWGPILAVLAVLTMFVGNLAALVQADLKRLLGYSAVAHAGYLMVALLAGPEQGGTGAALYYLVIYGLMNVGAFGVLIAIGRVGQEGREATRLEDLAGLGRRQPWLAAAFALFLFSLTGLPPTAGFLAKWYVFQAALGAELPWLAVFVVVNSVISAFTYLRPIAWMTMREPDEAVDTVADGVSSEVGAPVAVALTASATVIALSILIAGPIVEGARVAGDEGFAAPRAEIEAPGPDLALGVPTAPPAPPAPEE